MNLRFVEAFYWVATLRSISRAADRLFITQSAMSSRIATLEEELGTLLLDRRDKSFRLTIAGDRFLEHARKLLELQRIAKEELSGPSEPKEHVLRLGAIESVMHSWLIDWLSALRKSYDGLAIELTVETTPLLVDHIRRGVLDLVFSAAPAGGDSIRSLPLPPMQIAFLSQKPTRPPKKMQLSDLASADIMTFQRGSQPYVALVDFLRELPQQSARIHAISSISAMIELTEAGFGIAAIPRAAAEKFCETRNIGVLKTEFALSELSVFANYRVDAAPIDLAAAVDLAADYATRAEKKFGQHRKK
jgi:DNA-binding transcriptional LysR family regulator